MSQINKNQESSDNPNRKYSLYLANIIFLSCLTIISLVFALVVFFRLRTDGTDGIRQFYTKKQIESIEENAASNARNDLLLQIQSSLESGRGTTQMLREIFDDSIVVVNGGRYYFYPLADGVEANPIAAGTLSQRDGVAVYTGESPAVTTSQGILLSDNNGRIDWDRLAGSGIDETAIRVGTLEEDRFIPDQQFSRNCEKAAAKEMRISLCLDIAEPASEEVMQEAFAAIREAADQYGMQEAVLEDEESESLSVRAAAALKNAVDTSDDESEEAAVQGAIDSTVILRVRTAEDLSVDGTERTVWTEALTKLCKMTEEEGGYPVIGMGLYTSAAQIDLASLSKYDRWLIGHEETASFPYSFLFWEYSAEGNMEGVPGKSILYMRVNVSDSEDDSQ